MPVCMGVVRLSCRVLYLFLKSRKDMVYFWHTICNQIITGQRDFSIATLRYIQLYMFGYVQGKDN